MRKALFDSFIWRGANFLTILFLNVCIARIYEASQSGRIYFISNNFYLVLLIGGLSLDSCMTFFSASNRITSNKLASFSIAWSFIVAACSVLCTFFLIYFNYITSDYLFLLVAGVAYTFGISLTNFFTSLFYAKHHFNAPNITMSVINILLILMLLFFIKKPLGLKKEQFLYIYFLMFIVQGAGLALVYFKFHLRGAILQFPNQEEYRALFRFAVIALSANIAYYLIYRVDYFFVEAWCSSKSLGNYVQVSKMGQLLLIIPGIISSVVYPQAAKGENKTLVKFIMRMMCLFLILYIGITVCSYLFSNQVFIWMFGNTFNEMFYPFLLLLPGVLFLSLHSIIAAFFGGNNKPVYNVISTSAGLAVVITGDVLLIKPMGISGAALVSSIGYTTAFLVSLFLFMRITGSGWKDIFTAETFRLKTYTSFFSKSSNS